MKKINLIFSFVIALLLFTACEKEEFGPVVGVYTPPTLTDVSGSYTFTEEKATDVFKTFTWTMADFGFPSATSYILQIDFADNNFASAVDLVTLTGLSTSITIEKMNQKLLAMGAKTNVPSNIAVRVVAKVSDLVQVLESNASVMNILPYKVVIIYPSLYLPGNYQAASGYTSDWSPDKAQQIYSLKQNDKYEGYVNMVGSDIKFKFTDEPNWDVNWGDNGADGSLDSGGSDIAVPSAGYYKINADIKALTYSIMKTDWGLVGSATGSWDVDQNMTYDPASKTWKITLNLSAGEVKFRANDAWDLNYGDTGFDGVLDAGGDNIAIAAAGSYTVILNLEVPGYTYTITKN